MKAYVFIDFMLRGVSLILAMGQVLGAVWFLGHGAIMTIFPGLLLGMLAASPRQLAPKIGWVILVGIFGTGLALESYIIPLWQKSEEFDVKVLYILELLLILYFIASACGCNLLKKHKNNGERL